MSLSHAIGQTVRKHGGASIGARQHLGRRHNIQAPVSGLNTSDAWAAMRPKYAIHLDNFFPESGAVVLRRGCREHATEVGNGEVLSLFAHESGTVSKMFAVGGGTLYEVSDNAAGTSLKSGLTSSRWQTAMHGGHTVMVNGEDDPLRILPAGTLAAAHGWSKASGQDSIPFAASQLYRVLPFKGRLFFLQKDTANLWYGGLGFVQGELTRFALDRVHPDGGNAIGLGTITIDSGDGVDDLLCIFFDSGAVIVYQGADISSSSSWSLVGIWKIGRLVGDKAVLKYGGDLIALTDDGVVSVTKLTTGGELEAGNMRGNLSHNIANRISEMNILYGDVTGWDAALHTPANWLVINVPVQGGIQYVRNTQTGAWCRFTGWNARCFTRWNRKLYYGGTDGRVYETNVGASDNGVPIEGDCRGAFQYLGSSADKRFTMARALVDADANVSFVLGTTTDFNEDGGLEAPTNIVTGGAKWNATKWNTAKWAGGVFSLQEWQSLNRDGTAISVRLRSSTTGARLRYYAADVIAERTQGLL